MAVVRLRSLAELRRALTFLGEQAERDVVQAMRSAARYGATAALRQSAKTQPRPKASGTYERSWMVVRISDGATVSNSARHAVFVERGRKPGRAPPHDPILEWVYQKRLANRAKASKLRKKGGRTILASTRGAMRERSRARAIAIAIQKKIARRGTPGRWVLRETMPKIARRAHYEIRQAIRNLTSNPPR